MTLGLIVAFDNRFGIGRDGRLPWPHNREDMKRFADLTRDSVVVMGRKTWDVKQNIMSSLHTMKSMFRTIVNGVFFINQYPASP